MGSLARDVAMVALDDLTLQPLVLAAPTTDEEHALVLGADATFVPIAVGRPGPRARVVTGKLRADGQLRALVLAVAPGEPRTESCWIVNGAGLTACE